MRGQAKVIKALTISGRVFLEFEDQDKMTIAKKGDCYLYLFLESAHTNPAIAYQQKGYKGYLKVKIFDGSKWCQLDSFDFFQEKENYFSKHEISKHVFVLCKEILQQAANTEIYRSYRNHYTTKKYEQEGYKGKKGHYNLLKRTSA